ncbi:uncharacterized protein J4E87_000689 [Alternaria ethzedia]|uniref:uncharacterized protein n=1 Tax=Alternaria ethzedia TaxID=181014 RepID=UPI0020C3C36F|nr:uncharacterized protein J4E87_000689 [Alternaria ethzedia]KAI4635734.1 hypothetical protein J4E87_000689 [Alternaria ethzedia]
MDGLQDDTTLPPVSSPVDEEPSFISEEEEQETREDAMLERIRRPYVEYKKAHPQGNLCERCAGIDWSLLSDETHKQAQIKLMGRIYAESELVIIAAAGSTSHYGLPGVSSRPREAQRIIELDTGVHLIEMFEVDWKLNDTVWGERGWTHQEGYLATRRLVFTDSEVLYSCDRGTWQESVQRPGIDDHSFYMKNDYPGFPLDSREESRIAHVLNNYSKRKLSFEGDILNACTGTLEKLVDLHFWGIVARVSASTPNTQLSLEWRSWPYPGRKRTNFLSWSWVATTGHKLIEVNTHRNDRSFVAEVLTTDGRWLTSDNQMESRYDPLPEGSGPTLRLTGSFYTASLMSGELQKRGEKSEDRSSIVFQHTGVIGDETEVVFEVWLDTELTDAVSPDPVKAVPLNGRYEVGGHWEVGWCPAFMVLQAVGDHYRRIGATDRDCLIRSKKTGLTREMGRDDVIPRPGDEETIYIE